MEYPSMSGVNPRNPTTLAVKPGHPQQMPHFIPVQQQAGNYMLPYPRQRQQFPQPSVATVAGFNQMNTRPQFYQPPTSGLPRHFSGSMQSRSGIGVLPNRHATIEPRHISSESKKSKYFEEQQKKLKKSHVLKRGETLDPATLLQGFGGLENISKFASNNEQKSVITASNKLHGDDFGSFSQASQHQIQFTTTKNGTTDVPQNTTVNTVTSQTGQLDLLSSSNSSDLICQGELTGIFGKQLPHTLPTADTLPANVDGGTGWTQELALSPANIPQMHCVSLNNPKSRDAAHHGPKTMGLDTMMQQCSDLSGPQKSRGFHDKTSLNQIRSTHVIGRVHSASARSADWAIMDEKLTEDFTLPKEQPKRKKAAQPHTTNSHPLGRQRRRASSSSSEGEAKPIGLPPWVNNETLIPDFYKKVADAAAGEEGLDTEKLFPILVSSGLPREVLGHIWSLSNLTTPGQLTVPELYAVLALISRAQNAHDISTLKAIHGMGHIPVPILQHPDFAASSKNAGAVHGQGTPTSESGQATPALGPGHGIPAPGSLMNPDIPIVENPAVIHETMQAVIFQQMRVQPMKKEQAIYAAQTVPNPALPSSIQNQNVLTFQQDSVLNPSNVSLQSNNLLIGQPMQPSDVGTVVNHAVINQVFPSNKSSPASFSQPTRSHGLVTQRDLIPAAASGDGNDDEFTSYMSKSPEAKAKQISPSFVDHNPAYLSDSEADGSGTLAFMTSGSCEEVGMRLASYEKPAPFVGTSPTCKAGESDYDEYDDDFNDFQTAPSAVVNSQQSSGMDAMTSNIDRYSALRDLMDSGAVYPVAEENGKQANILSQNVHVQNSAPSEWNSTSAMNNVAAEVNSKQSSDLMSVLSNDIVSIPKKPAHEMSDALQDDFDDFVDFQRCGDTIQPSQPDLCSIYSISGDPMSNEVQVLKNTGDVKPTLNEKYALFIKLKNSSPTFVQKGTGGWGDGCAPPETKSKTTVSDHFLADLTNYDYDHAKYDDIDITDIRTQNNDYKNEESLSQFGAFYSMQPPPLKGNLTPGQDSQSVSSLDLPGVEKTSSSDSERVSIGKHSDTASLDLKSVKSLSLADGEESLEGQLDSEKELNSQVMEEPSRIPVDPSSLFNLPGQMPLTIDDRYNQLHEDQKPDTDRHAYEWQRGLQMAKSLLQNANDIFNNISGSDVCNEVAKSEEGSSYLQSIVEVYRFVLRLEQSMKSWAVMLIDLHTLIKDIELLWTNLTAFIASSYVMPDPDSMDFHKCVLKPEDGLPKACGVCLLNVNQRSRAFDNSNDTNKLTYGGRQYHAACANFWVNCVDSTLPALPLRELL